MITPIKNLYFCQNCKKITSSLSDLFFVEENSVRGFCSELCIEEFYSGLVNHFLLEDKKIRKEIGEVEPLEENENFYLDQILNSPEKILKNQNELHEVYYTFFKKIESRYFVCVCFIYNNAPSFVHFLGFHTSERYNSFFENGTPVNFSFSTIEDPSQNITSEELEYLEQKKSFYISKILESRRDDDIHFEDLVKYEFLKDNTISSADFNKVLESDLIGDVEAFAKITKHDGKTIYNLVLMATFKTQSKMPILTIPSYHTDIIESLFEYKVYQKN